MINSYQRPFCRKIHLLIASALLPLAIHAATINVSTSSQLSSAAGSANPGDTIVLANGNYSGFTMKRSGNSSAAITFQAANVGGAVITSGTIQITNCSYVNLDGLKFTTSGGSTTVDGTSRAFAVLIVNANHCRVTRCTFALSGQASGTGWVTLDANSQHNQIDHCAFGPNSVGGHSHYIFPAGSHSIPGVTPPSCRDSWANGFGPYNPDMPRYTEIDHNYFHDMGSGDGETIVLGGAGVCGDYQGTMSTVENNLFVNCNGDPEVVSIKSSTNTVRFNTFVTCQAVVSFRSGNGSSVYGNFFLCGGVSGSGGVKINEMHHKVYNNYIENAGSYPIMLEDGDLYCTNSFAHAQVVDAEIEYNTVVNSGEVLVGHNSTSPLKPTQCVFANNIITGSGTLFHETSGSSVTYSQNIINGYNPGKSGFIVENPSLTSVTENTYSLQKLSSGSPAIGNANTSYFSYVTTDMDGQTRSSPDIGADEYSTGSISIQPLTTSDVGPASGGGIIGGGGSLPSGWTDADIGSVGIAGSASYSSGTFTLNGSGSDIWSTSDSFNYAYQSVNGDQTIIARVASEDNTSSWAKNGVMFRESTANDASYVGLYVTPGNGVSMQYRNGTGTSAADAARQAGLTPPYWVKLVRSGDTFTGYSSADGASWTEVGSASVTMAGSVDAGLVDCAHNNTALNTSTFDNVSISASAPPPDFSLSSSPNSLTIPQGNNGTSTITVNPVNGFSGSVSLSASGLPSGVTASFNPSSTTGSSTLTLTASSSAATGTATVTITGTSGSLQHTTTVSLTVSAAPDFSLSASPNSLTVTQGNNGTSAITVNPVNGFNSSVSLTASGLPSGVTASFNPSSTTSSSTLTLTASGTATTGTATITVTGTSGSLQHTTTISLTVNASSGGGLPSGWTDADIGSVGTAGSAGYNSGVFTVSGSGSDIWSTADGFNYAYQSVSGDQTIVARVVSENGSQSYAKAGVMIRESTASDSVFASVVITPTNGVAMEIRPTTGASAINVAGWIRGVSPAQWVKVVRSGDTFNGYYSADGSTWTQIASTNVTMNSSATAGLAITAHDTTSLNTATFDNVSIGGSSGGGIDITAIYQIQNEASGLVLNNQGKLTNGSAITQWSSASSDNLRWTFIPTSNGYYQINSVKSGLDAVVQGASTANGAGIVQWSFGSSGNDQWQPVQNSDGSYTFYNLNSGLVLEDPGSSTSTSTQMDQWTANGGSNQKWNLLKQ